MGTFGFRQKTGILTKKQLAEKFFVTNRQSANGKPEVHIVKDIKLDVTTSRIYITCIDKVNFTDNSERKCTQKSELSAFLLEHEKT